MGAIDIGAAAIDRPSSQPNDKTYIALANPANDTGNIASFELWFVTNASGVIVGTAYGSGGDYTTRDHETIGSVTSGSKQTFSGLDCDVTTGDYAAIYYAAGAFLPSVKFIFQNAVMVYEFG